MSQYVIYGFFDRGNFLGFFVGDFGFEFLFQSHYKLHSIQGISAQVFNEGSITAYLFFLNAELLADKFFTLSSTLLMLKTSPDGS